jgi:hypothetical protein
MPLQCPVAGKEKSMTTATTKGQDKITALYCRLSVEDMKSTDEKGSDSNSIKNQELICKGWFLPPNTYDCGSLVEK